MDSFKKQKITRRKFVKGVTGAALCCACLPLEAMAAPAGISENKIDVSNGVKAGEAKVHLAAACGTYCGACPAYLNKHGEGDENFPSESINESIDNFVNMMNKLQCDGCLSGGVLAGHCQTCSIRLHAASEQTDSRCADCEELPCYRVTNLINMDHYPHREEYLPNLEKISEMGVEAWVIYEEERWSCPRCGMPISWYDTRCTACGAPRSRELFSLFENELPRRNPGPILNLLLD